MTFLKNLAFVFFVFLVTTVGHASDVQTECKLPDSLKEILGTFDSHKLDPYKNVCVEIKSPSSVTAKNIKVLTDKMQEFFKNHALYVTFPVVHGSFSNVLEKLGYKLCECNAQSKTLTYILLNGRNIPELNYAYTAAAVCLLRNNPENGEREILLISEPSKNIANIIGGISEKGEFPEETVVREVKEEVGLSIDPKNLKLFAISHTVRADKKTCVGYYFICDQYDGTVKVDGVEVSECAWIPLSEAMKEGAKLFGKPFYPLYQELFMGELRKEDDGKHFNKTMKLYQKFADLGVD